MHLLCRFVWFWRRCLTVGDNSFIYQGRIQRGGGGACVAEALPLRIISFTITDLINKQLENQPNDEGIL